MGQIITLNFGRAQVTVDRKPDFKVPTPRKRNVMTVDMARHQLDKLKERKRVLVDEHTNFTHIRKINDLIKDAEWELKLALGLVTPSSDPNIA